MDGTPTLTIKDSFVDLERQRRRLEENVQQLRKSLQYWQVWEAEYEGLKEEIAGLNENASVISSLELERVGKEFGGDLLNHKEIRELLNDSRGQARNASQVQGLLSRRIDYVQENVKVMKRRLNAAEEKLFATTVVSQPHAIDEEGLPLTEIREELDDDDNIISSSVSKPGDSTPQMLEALKKAGVEVPSQGPAAGEGQADSFSEEESHSTKEPESKAESHSKGEAQSKEQSHSKEKPNPTGELRFTGWPHIEDEAPVQSQPDHVEKESALPSIPEFGQVGETVSSVASNVAKRPSISSASRKKSVSFSETVQIQTPASPEESHASSHARRASQDLRERMLLEELEEQKAFKLSSPAKQIELDSPISSPTIPPDESPEDAALRKQMLDYSMSEVGAIVAEINLDENGSYDSERFDESDDTDEDDEEEDEFGRATSKVIDEDYRAQMLALERKLNAKMLENVGPHDDVTTQEPEASNLHYSKADIVKDTVNERKAVRFAADVDVSQPKTGSPNSLPRSNPLSDIIERPASIKEKSGSTKRERPSKFKSRTRVENRLEADHRPATDVHSDNSLPRPPFASGQTHAGTIHERAPPIQMSDSNAYPGGTPLPVPPDEIDDVTMNQELAMEYNRLRNRMIQGQGGFMKATDDEDDEEEEPSDLFDEPKVDGGKRVSRFKAARLGGSKASK